MRITVSLPSDDVSMYGVGLDVLNLSEEALGVFSWALDGVEFDLEVDPETGHYEILEVRDGHRVLRPVKEYEELVTA